MNHIAPIVWPQGTRKGLSNFYLVFSIYWVKMDQVELDEVVYA